MSLFKNYLLSLVRNAGRDKFFTVLNLLGLAIGITATIMISLYIQDQLTYDKQNANFERIYRIGFPFWTFIISLLLSLCIAVITVSWQSLKASRMNPATSIRAK